MAHGDRARKSKERKVPGLKSTRTGMDRPVPNISNGLTGAGSIAE